MTPASDPQAPADTRRRVPGPAFTWVLPNPDDEQEPTRLVVPALVAALLVVAGVTAAWFAATAAAGMGLGWLVAAAWAVLALVLPALAAIDLVCHRLPNVIVYPTVLVTLIAAALAVTTGTLPLGTLGAAALVAAGVFLGQCALAMVSGGFGMGDIKLATLAAFTLALASPALGVLGAVIYTWPLALGPALITLATRGKDAGMPFGPAIAASVLVCLVAPGVGLEPWQMFLAAARGSA